MRLSPISREQAAKYITNMHRHHDPVTCDKYRVAAVDSSGNMIGVVQVGNPVARALCDGYTLEVVRLCTDGTRNVCSYLYSAAARIARDMGYRKIITYILDTEDGSSLRAAGWHKEADTRGHIWSCPSRPRKTTAPTCNKQRWVKEIAPTLVREPDEPNVISGGTSSE